MHANDKIGLLLKYGNSLHDVLIEVVNNVNDERIIDLARNAILDWQYSVREVLQDCKSVEEINDNSDWNGR